MTRSVCGMLYSLGLGAAFKESFFWKHFIQKGALLYPAMSVSLHQYMLCSLYQKTDTIVQQSHIISFQCNGHGDLSAGLCNSSTGVCFCTDHTEGDDCQACKENDGYFGEPRKESLRF
jgi:hypothetical protein